ncbi:MAG: Na+/H+ antiporter [Deltaproteobacteria bacterium]|uniref:Na+/H+ antiporter n=1 Tax=Candidatus Zymogenus saltonus TaxID=2844893 RepID=A0A9D8K8N6_9DELT|nr:Na+/H+ antiporter [Candidatus Zymogenus saltonus]
MELAIEREIIALLIVVTSVAMIVRRIKLPYTVALVIVGLALGFFHALPDLHLTPEILFFVLLPSLLFEAAFHLDIRDFLRNAWTIVILAVPGVLFTMAVVAGIVFLGLGWSQPAVAVSTGAVLLFGALISATDPISVLAIFKKLGISRKLTVVIEGESLFNDGTAVVIFTIVLAAINGGGIGIGAGLQKFVIVVAGGIAVGACLGLFMSILTAQVDDHLIEITLTSILAYGSYLVAEELHVSGVIAVVVAGMMSGNFGTKYGMSPTTKLAVESFWEYVVFVVNSIVFILIGIELTFANLLDNIVPILIAWGAVLVSRLMVIYLTRPIVNRLGNDVSLRWAMVLVWGGIRGSISMVLILSLPKDFPYRELILSMTFGVVFLTLIGQGMTMRPLLRRLGLVTGPTKERETYEKYRGGLSAVGRVMEEIETMAKRKEISPSVYKRLREQYRKRSKTLEKGLSELHLEKDFLKEEELISVRRHLLMVEKDAVKDAYGQGLISDEAMRELTKEVDAKLTMMEGEKE